MKKWLIGLSCVFVLSGCVSTPKAENAPLFPIDPVATAEAPWKVGERISDAVCPKPVNVECYRVFLGVTPDGHKVAQEFYAGGEHKATDPFLIRPAVSWDGMTRLQDVENPLEILGSNLTAWYLDGSKALEWVKKSDNDFEVTVWRENGPKEIYLHVVDNEAVKVITWDEDGKVLEEIELGKQ